MRSTRVSPIRRYRIVHARAGVWAAVLKEALGVRAEALAPVPVAVRGGPLSVDATLAVLHLAVVRPDVVVERQPDCGCDACDSGSSDLLEAVDATVRHVVGGPFVVLRGERWRAEWHPEGGSAGGDGRGPDFRVVMDLCRRLAEGEAVRLPEGTEAFVGRSWLG